eukprot:m.29585 g.29585  ORF g.29585 m.29585 type:complete len:152 (+) comp6717_c0_seq1:2638-3093(+)
MIVRLFVFPTPCDLFLEKLNIFHSQASEKSGHFTVVFDTRPSGGGGVKRWEARVLCARLETNDVLVSFDLLLHPRLVFRPEYVMIGLRDVRIRDLWLKRRESSEFCNPLESFCRKLLIPINFNEVNIWKCFLGGLPLCFELINKPQISLIH